MSTPFLGEIRLMSFNYPPKGWALCEALVGTRSRFSDMAPLETTL